MVLHLQAGKGRIRMHVYCIPVHATCTRLMVVSARDFGRYNPLARIFDELNRIIVLEDRAVVESSKPSEVPPPGVEHCVATDRATLQFRKYYYDTLKTASDVQATLRVLAPDAVPSPAH